MQTATKLSPSIVTRRTLPPSGAERINHWPYGTYLRLARETFMPDVAEETNRVNPCARVATSGAILEKTK